ncbi:MAG: hypothetical protein H0T89_37040 [Deltaproteobacteria bacterium]|nr:hypothetical protein [Deltaproteobacteria bacterium]MDQ3296519.1 hypothetical protein [Myxococcota bacterium]
MSGYTREMIAMLQAQRAYFSSDELVRDRAESFRGLSPEECWGATIEACEEVEWLFSLMDPETRARAELPEVVPVSVIAKLEAMQRR